MNEEELQACLNWLCAKLTISNGLFCLSTDYSHEQPVYFGSDIDKLLEIALEDYADWDES
jgi:hypothetical protein